MHGIKLVKLCRDVMSGGKDVRPGLTDALRTPRVAPTLIVLKFDRLSRSIKHFCELYETYFKDGTKSWYTRESIRLTRRWGGRWGIPLVFAQMEREATGERTRGSDRPHQAGADITGKVPCGKRTTLPGQSEDEDSRRRRSEQRIIAQIKGVGEGRNRHH